MTAMKASDLHLKKELTQIRKAARVLRDPGTTSSWKSPLNSSRSVALNQSVDIENVIPELDLQVKSAAKDKRVFLYNWRSQRSSSEKSAAVGLRDGLGGYEVESESSSVQGSADDVLSDARNPGDSRSDTYVGESMSASMLFRRRDTNLVSPSMKRVLAAGGKKKSKKSSANLDVLSRYQQKEINLRRLLKGHPPLHSGFGRDHSAEGYDDTHEYSHPDDLKKFLAESPSSLKLKTKNLEHRSLGLLRGSRKEDTSYTYSTPALSTSSFNRYYNRNPGTVGSWDATTISGDNDIGEHLDLPGRQGCGIPCYWSRRTPRHRGSCGNCCSPSLSDTLKRKGSSILCGSRSVSRRRRGSSTSKQKIASRSAQGVLPLLRNSADSGGGSSMGSALSDDEISTNFGELDLEALSRLDGRRWSNCYNQDGTEVETLNGEGDEEGSPENGRSLSQKYRPVLFSEVIGQNIVIQSLINAISMGRIAPVYLFLGPRGTGKTSTARIFAAALNCTSTEEAKPCGYCRECSAFISGNTRDVFEVDGTNKRGIDKVRYILKKVSQGIQLGTSRYKVFLVDECHLLPLKIWLDFLKFLEEPPQQIVFIFITTAPDNVPRSVQSRCQKYLFNKIKDTDIVARLKKITNEENLDVELDALDLISLNVDGSLRDAETMLEQLSLLGKRITTSVVNELVGFVSDEKLLELLELALSSDTAETVKRAKDLMDSGMDPMGLMSQLAGLIMDIIAGTHTVDAKYGDSFIRGSLNEAELKRLKHALKLLSKAEKQLRSSSDRSTWFIATLLQLGTVTSPSLTQSSRHSSRTNEEDPSSALIEATIYKLNSDAQYLSRRSSSSASLYREMDGSASYQLSSHRQLLDGHASSTLQNDELDANVSLRYRNPDKLDEIWLKCIKGCHSKTLRQLLYVHGKLLSISQHEGVFIVYVAFDDEDIKARAERFLSSITNSIELVLRYNVEVKLINLSSEEVDMICANQALLEGQKKAKANCSDAKTALIDDTSTELLTHASADIDSMNNGRQEVPMQRIESIIREQRLETAWLQAAEKGTPRSLSRMRPEKNQVLPREDILPNSAELKGSLEISSQQFEDELNHEVKALKVEDQDVLNKEQMSKTDHGPLSPSLLHDGSYMGNSFKQFQGYESSIGARGCCAIFGLRTSRRKRSKVKSKGTPVRSRRRGGRYSLFGKCVKHEKN